MTYLNFLPFFISGACGYFLIGLIFPKDQKPDFALHFFLSGGLGLALSSQLVFYSLLGLGRFRPEFVVGLHLVLCAVLSGAQFFRSRKLGKPFLKIASRNLRRNDVLALGATIVVLLLLQPMLIFQENKQKVIANFHTVLVAI